MTVIDIVLAIFAILILIGLVLSFVFILSVVVVSMKCRKEEKELLWICSRAGNASTQRKTVRTARSGRNG